MIRCPSCGNEILYGSCQVCSGIRHDRMRSGRQTNHSDTKRRERQQLAEQPNKKQSDREPIPSPSAPALRVPKPDTPAIEGNQLTTSSEKQIPLEKNIRRTDGEGMENECIDRLRDYNKRLAALYAQKGVLSLILKAQGFNNDSIGRLKRPYLDEFLSELDKSLSNEEVDVQVIEQMIVVAARTVLTNHDHVHQLESDHF